MVGLAVKRVPVYDRSKPGFRGLLVFLHVVVVTDAEVAFRQQFLHFAQMLFRLWSQRIVRIF